MDVDRAIGRALFVVVLCMPLLPAGPAYLGFAPQPWLPVAVLALPVLAVVALRHYRRRTVPPAGAHAPVWFDSITAAWAVFVAAAVGAGVIGLAASNDLASPVFRYNLRDTLRLLGPIDRQWDPLYPLLPVLVIAQGLLVYVAVRALCLYADDPRRRSLSVLRAWAYGFGLVGAFAVFQYLTRFRLLPFWVEINPALTRSHATLDDPNALGSYLALGILLCLGLAVASKGWRAKTAAALAALGGAALLTTASRAAIGGFALAGLAAIAMPGGGNAESPARMRWRRSARWLLAVGAAVLVASLFARVLIDFEPVPYHPGNVVSALTGVLDPRIPLADSLGHRGVWWSAALHMARDAPVLGVGLGRFPLLLPRYIGPAAGNLDAHNYFLQVLAEMGIVGLLAFGALLAAVLGTLAWLRRASAAPRLSGAALLGSIAFVATFVTGHPLLLASGQTLWATMLAAVVVAARPGEPSGEPLQPRTQSAGGTLPSAHPVLSGTRTALA
ncbi:MAG: O-antigen ligase family protein, partial [Acidobacteriota bacterium]